MCEAFFDVPIGSWENYLVTLITFLKQKKYGLRRFCRFYRFRRLLIDCLITPSLNKVFLTDVSNYYEKRKIEPFNQSLCEKKSRNLGCAFLDFWQFFQLFDIPARSSTSVILRQPGQPFRSSLQVPLSAVSRVRFKVMRSSFEKLNFTAFSD